MRKALSLLIVSLGLAVGSFAQTTAATFPKVVAVFHRCNQTDTISTAAIFTPKAGGLFRFMIYGELLKASDKAAYWSPTLTLTNHIGEVTYNFVMQASPVTTSTFGLTSWDRGGISDKLRRQFSRRCE
jgi:hypothetical protein